MKSVSSILGKPIDIYSAIENLIKQNSANLRCHTYSKIVAVNIDNTIDVQPLCQEFRNTEDGKIPVNLPKFKSIKYFGTPNVGDICILLHLDRTINIEQTEDGYFKPTKQNHTFSDVIAICDYNSPVGIIYFDSGVQTVSDDNLTPPSTASMVASFKIDIEGDYLINCWSESDSVSDSSITNMYAKLSTTPAHLFVVRYFLNSGGGACGSYSAKFNAGDIIQMYIYNSSASSVGYRYKFSVTRLN